MLRAPAPAEGGVVVLFVGVWVGAVLALLPRDVFPLLATHWRLLALCTLLVLLTGAWLLLAAALLERVPLPLPLPLLERAFPHAALFVPCATAAVLPHAEAFAI